jgi:hypothetical protein
VQNAADAQLVLFVTRLPAAAAALLLLLPCQVWDWLARITPEERQWIYTPKAERAAGIVEGLKAILADKLAAHAERQRKAAQQRALTPKPAVRALRG